ncbi:MAG: amidohydrolase [Acidobacteriota bacterium]
MTANDRRWWILALALAALTSCTPANPSAADLLFLGDHIVTLGPEPATAVAVVEDTIVWIGDRADSAAWQGPETKVHELGDRALVPGFIDAHGHLTFTAQTLDMANIASPPVGPVETIADLAVTLEAFIEERGIAEGDWVVGLGYDDSLIAEQRHPERLDLDAVSTTHRIALTHVSGHLMALNSLALEAVGYGPDTEDPPGGHLRREADGRTPNGVLEETALGPVRGAVMRPLNAEQIRKALVDYASYGVTTVQDGGAGRAQIEGLAAMAREEELPLDVVAYQAMGRGMDELPADIPVGEYQRRFKLGGVKLVLDGSPQGKTAFLTRPYHVPPPGQSADYVGYPMFPPARIDAWVDRFYGTGVPMLAHANGDAAADILIEAVQKASAAHGAKDHRTVMIHAQTVREDQLDEMAELQMVPSFFSAHTFYWGDWHRDSVLGPERGSRISPTRTTKDRGMHFTVHNDTPIVPSDMIRLLWATTNRRTRSGQELGPEHALTVEEALFAMTLDAAYQSFEEDEKGSIEAGKLADLVVLSRDPREGPVLDLLDVEVLATLSHGAWVFDDAGFAGAP